MKKQFISSKLVMIFLLTIMIISMLIAVVVNLNKPKIMILHSYHPDYAWTREVDVGLHRIMDQWFDYRLNWHYMNTKNYNDKEKLERAGMITRKAIDIFDPQILIAIDDFAQSLAAKYYVNKPGIDIIFAGVNGSVDKYNYPGAKNVTGIFEHKQLQPVKNIIKEIEALNTHPRTAPRLLYLMDPSSSIKLGQARIDNYSWDPVQYQGSVVAESFTDWKQTVLDAEKSTDYIIVSNYRKLPVSHNQTNFMNPMEVMSWTEANSKVPVIGINTFNVEDGAMISIGVLPYEQGIWAAKMARKIIEEKISAARIPFYENNMYTISMRQRALDKRNIELPSIYEAFARVTGAYYID